jgi:hypothetical protein
MVWVEMPLRINLLPLIVITVLAFLAISIQTLKAAVANPINALREE